MRTQPLIAAALSIVVLVGVAACTTQVDGTATAGNPTLVTQKDLAKRLPEPSFFGATAKADSTYQSDLGFYCQEQVFADPTTTDTDADPIEISIQQQGGSNDLDAGLQQVAIIATAFGVTKNAKEFATGVQDQIKACPPSEQIDFGSNVQNLTYVQRAYSHAGWKGTALLSKISIVVKDSGSKDTGIQLSVAARKRNVQVQFNVYGAGVADADAALAAAQAQADKLLDELATAK